MVMYKIDRTPGGGEGGVQKSGSVLVNDFWTPPRPLSILYMTKLKLVFIYLGLG